MDCKTSALCLFDEQDVQTDIVGTSVVDYYPLTSLSAGGPIEFHIPGSTDEYIDLNDCQLLVHVKITKKDGTAIDNTKDKVCLVNQPISSLFQDVFLTIGDTQVEGGQHCYPYNGYLSSLLQFHPSAKKTHMQSWGWNEDSPGKFDDDKNKGIQFRAKETDKSNVWELMGPLFLDMTRQSRYLLPQTDIRLKLLPSKSDFALQVYGGTDKDYVYKITKCVLYARRMRVNDSVISGHNKGLEKHNAKYPLRHMDIGTFTITKGVSNFVKDHLYPSQTPKMLIIGCLEHDSFNGNIEKSPFNFQHFDLSKIGLYRDGELVPGQIFQPNFKNHQFIHSYVNTMVAMNYFNTDDSNGMTIEHFENGYTLHVFDLTPDANSQAPYRNIVKNTSLRLEMSFDTPLPDTINVMLFAIFDSKLEITRLRDVFMNYTR